MECRHASLRWIGGSPWKPTVRDFGAQSTLGRTLDAGAVGQGHTTGQRWGVLDILFGVDVGLAGLSQRTTNTVAVSPRYHEGDGQRWHEQLAWTLVLGHDARRVRATLRVCLARSQQCGSREAMLRCTHVLAPVPISLLMNVRSPRLVPGRGAGSYISGPGAAPQSTLVVQLRCAPLGGHDSTNQTLDAAALTARLLGTSSCSMQLATTTATLSRHDTARVEEELLAEMVHSASTEVHRRRPVRRVIFARVGVIRRYASMPF